MLGFHADGIRLFGASDTLVAALKKHKLPLVKTSTTNTLVFAVTAEPLTKKLYLPSFLAPQAPWFSCFVGDAERPAEYSLHFAAEEDLVDFILSMYYCAQGFLHLDFDLAELVTKLNPSPEYVIHSFEEKDFHKIGEEGAFAACFCFLEGGFMESDRLFGKLTKEYGVGADKIMLAGSFDSKYQFLRTFIPQK